MNTRNIKFCIASCLRDAGVTEIWFIDHEKKVLQIHRYDEKAKKYTEEIKTSGIIQPLDWKKFNFKVEWLWELPKLTTIQKAFEIWE